MFVGGRGGMHVCALGTIQFLKRHYVILFTPNGDSKWHRMCALPEGYWYLLKALGYLSVAKLIWNIRTPICVNTARDRALWFKSFVFFYCGCLISWQSDLCDTSGSYSTAGDFYCARVLLTQVWNEIQSYMGSFPAFCHQSRRGPCIFLHMKWYNWKQEEIFRLNNLRIAQLTMYSMVLVHDSCLLDACDKPPGTFALLAALSPLCPHTTKLFLPSFLTHVTMLYSIVSNGKLAGGCWECGWLTLPQFIWQKSLDVNLERRKKVASRLVEASGEDQIIFLVHGVLPCSQVLPTHALPKVVMILCHRELVLHTCILSHSQSLSLAVQPCN